MKKIVFFIAMVCVCGSAMAQITISRDKPLHFGAGFVIGSVGGYAAHHMFDGNPYWMWAGAVGSSLAAGITKEQMDKVDSGVWDNNDILYTTLGGIASAVVLDLFLKKSRKRRKYRPCNCYDVTLSLPQTSKYRKMEIGNSKSHDIIAKLQAQRILEMP
jgi:hypothetical protein